MTNTTNWTDNLQHETFRRLCDCRTRKEDLPELVNAKWNFYKKQGKNQKGLTKEDALVAVLDLLDSNGCFIDLTENEYKSIISEQ